MENLRFQSNESLNFETLRDFVEYIHSRLKETNILSQRYRFVADVVKVKPYNGTLYITVSQEGEDGKKFELTVVVWKHLLKGIMSYLYAFGVKSINDLEHKKWEFQGRLSFYPDRFQFSFWADSIAPQGESDILRRRQKIREELRKQGLLMEVTHELSELEPIKLIAVITSKTAQGYFDFLSNLLVPETYRPVIHLYESSMQGVSTAQEVIAAMNRIELFCRTNNVRYDVIAIIRGGGGPSDLMFFDDYELAVRIAYMNKYIPVLTGIGHEKDETVADYVAWRRFPTPTAVAKEISNQLKTYIDNMERSYNELSQKLGAIVDITESKLQSGTFGFLSDSFKNNLVRSVRDIKEYAKYFVSKINISDLEKRLSVEFATNVSRNLDSRLSEFGQFVDNSFSTISKQLTVNLERKINEVKTFENISTLMDKSYIAFYNKTEGVRAELETMGGPLRALSVGGALVTKDGEIVSSVKQIKSKDIVKVNFVDGQVTSRVI
ncbi:exodeoxyribonuclease VII large subunit [Fervidobacterium islandicum]|uniref:Exodeoxyribonuclease 7 large subunit n=1 Tax=Fervidobacterium islandicum TaxID=2423 RepID=A0AAI8GDK3_FERIS|nr:exodeoxyribonuclease VII large subunit [Fervidobacterium islandicum]AMW33363.1 exodeoxyribonuclease VII large subunit [Fervidobacterium islandicum]